jgi:hypothetical protein
MGADFSLCLRQVAFRRMEANPVDAYRKLTIWGAVLDRRQHG